MALISCRECEKQISNLAAHCVHCGAPTGTVPPSLPPPPVPVPVEPPVRYEEHSKATAILLAFLFGPLGVFYCAPAVAAVLCLFAVPVALFATPGLLGVWLISILIACVAKSD